MAYERIAYETGGRRATIWLDRPEVRNAVDRQMAEELRAAVIEASRDPEVRVIVYRGRGADFCTGSDLAGVKLDRLGKSDSSFDPSSENGFPATFSGVRLIDNDEIPKLTVAVVQGYAVGGGFELALQADFLIVTDDAVLGDFHINRGVVGGGGLLWNIARMAGLRRMRELVHTGRTLTGREAVEWGLANRSVPAPDLEAELDSFVDSLARHSPEVQRLAKLAYSRALESDKDTLAVLEQMLLLGVLGSDDAREGISAFVEKRPPEWGRRDPS